MRRIRRGVPSWFIDHIAPTGFRFFNPIAVRVLGSRCHPLMSWYIAAVRFQGRRTGRTYAVPFTHRRLDDRTFECTTSRRALWWRNFIDGRPVTLLFKGRHYDARAEAIQDPEAIAEALGRRDRFRLTFFDLPVEESVALRITLLDGESRNRHQG